MQIVYSKKIHNIISRKAYKNTILGILYCVANTSHAGIHIPGIMLGNDNANGAICSSTQATTDYHCILPSSTGFTFHSNIGSTSGYPDPTPSEIFAEISTNQIRLGESTYTNKIGDVALGNNSKTTTVEASASSTVAGKTYNYAGNNPTNAVAVGESGQERIIQSVAAGRVSSTSTDAVNGSQLYAAYDAINAIYQRQMTGYDSEINQINQNISDLKEGAYAGIAGALAIGNLPQPTSSGKNMISGGMGTYKGHSAAAFGFSSVSENDKFIWKMGASFDSNRNSGGAVSMGYQW